MALKLCLRVLGEAPSFIKHCLLPYSHCDEVCSALTEFGIPCAMLQGGVGVLGPESI